jgi:Fructose-1-6-bisphosphatase, N-terminal domain
MRGALQGEDQKKLDVISNDIFCNVLRSSGRTGTIASEEEDLPVAVEETFSGNYVVVFDPLDGSSNIDAGISVGSIWGARLVAAALGAITVAQRSPGAPRSLRTRAPPRRHQGWRLGPIYRSCSAARCMPCAAERHRSAHAPRAARAGIYEPSDECDIEDMDNPDTMLQNCVLNVCQPGNRLLSAGYVLYSSSTILVLTIGEGVFIFTLDATVGEFILTHDDVKIPQQGKIYSFNEGNYGLWDDGVKAYMDSLKDADKWGGKPYSVRAFLVPLPPALRARCCGPHRAAHQPL